VKSWDRENWYQVAVAIGLTALLLWGIVWSVQHRLPQPQVACYTITLDNGDNGTECIDKTTGQVVCADNSGNRCADLSPPPLMVAWDDKVGSN
jgi:hypothetical protein